MRKKVFFAMAPGLFGVAIMFNMNAIQSNIADDVSLENIAVMAQAQSELPGVTITCSAGPDGKCYAEGEPRRVHTPFGSMLCETTCVFSGWQSDYCISGMPTPC